MLDLTLTIFSLIDVLIGDYLDIIIGITIILFSILVVTWTVIALLFIHLFFRNTETQLRKTLFTSLLVFFLVTNVFYYISIPRDYVSQLGWRNSVSTDDFFGSRYNGPDKSHKLTLLHYNVIVVAKVDSWFLKERLLPSDDNLLELITFIADIPAFIIKSGLWIIWSFFLQYYWCLYPHTIGFALATILLTAIFTDENI